MTDHGYQCGHIDLIKDPSKGYLDYLTTSFAYRIYMFSLLLSIVAGLSILDTPLSSLSVCEGSAASSIMQVDSVAISPNPMKRGQDINISIVGSTSETIKDGAKLHVTLGSFAGFDQDLCKETAKQGHPCPIAPGPLTMTQVSKIPGVVPSGTYNVKITATNADGKSIACLQGTLSF